MMDQPKSGTVYEYEPRYIITHDMLRYVGEVEAAREVVNHAALVPAWEAQFRQDALSRTIHHGTHLEGNELSREQAVRIVQLNETLAERAAQKAGIVGRDRDVQEVINYRRAMEWIDSVGKPAKEPVVVNERLFCDLHDIISFRLLPEGQRGVYRLVDVVVKNSRTGEVTFRPPKVDDIGTQLKGFFGWLNSESGRRHHPVIRAGITHYELVRVHPFTDGNGRTARALALLLLFIEGYDVKRFFSLDEYYDQDAAEYYTALQSVGSGESYDLTYWLEYFTLGLAKELNKVKLEVLKLSRDIQLKAKIGHQVALSERQIKILETIQNGSGGRAVSADLEKVLPMVSVDTILRDVKDLLRKGLIKKRGKTKGAYYEMAH